MKSMKLEDKKNLYDVSLSQNIKISFEQTSCPYENYALKIRDELLKQIEEDMLKIDQIKEEPCTSAEDVSGDNDTGAEDNAPLVTIADIGSDGKHEVEDPDEIKDVVLPKQLKRSSSNEESIKVVTEHSRGAVLKQCITQTTRKKFKVNDVLSNTIKVKNANEISKQNDVDTISDKQFSCDFCVYRTNIKYYFTRHLRTHTGEKLFACNNCSYKCNQKTSLTQHLRTHTGEKPFSCDICSYKCKQKAYLTQHLRTHTGEKPFSCYICSYKCNYKASLTQHLRMHTGEKPFSCDICSYKCSYRASLIQHLRTHTGEKPFACNICSYKCSYRASLIQHLRTHTGKPFSCKVCEYKFSSKSLLNIHFRIHTGEKPFSCNNCSYKCNQKVHLIKHLRKHTGEK